MHQSLSAQMLRLNYPKMISPLEVMNMISKTIRLALQLAIVFAFTAVIVHGQSRKPNSPAAISFNEPASTQQPFMMEYKGVRIGMTAEEAHAKIGTGQRIDQQEFYVFGEQETAQLLFDKANKVIAISVDYLGGVGAPDYRTVVGPDINVKADGSMYKIIHYDKLGFWVSYNKTANTGVVMVSITIQKQM
jgi:hypothetical protein